MTAHPTGRPRRFPPCPSPTLTLSFRATARRSAPGPTQIDTPALLLDRDRLERNIAAMAAFAAGGPAKLRPHSKTHKCVEIARLQLAAGATGITCAKVGEAEALAERRHPRHPDRQPGGRADQDRPPGRAGPPLHRDDRRRRRRQRGRSSPRPRRRPASPCAATSRSTSAWRAAACPTAPPHSPWRAWCGGAGLVFAGLQTYEGHLQKSCRWPSACARPSTTWPARAPPERRSRPAACRRRGQRRRHRHAHGHRPPAVHDRAAVRLLRHDGRRSTAAVGGADFENALTVLATVISRPQPDRAVIDAGLRPSPPSSATPPCSSKARAGSTSPRSTASSP